MDTDVQFWDCQLQQAHTELHQSGEWMLVRELLEMLHSVPSMQDVLIRKQLSHIFLF